MKAALRSIETPEGESLDTIRPDSGSFCIPVLALIGPEGEDGEEIFQFEVCSPDWLAQELEAYPAIWGDRRLIMSHYDPVAIETHVRKRLRHAIGTDWNSVAQKIGQWATWEFEEYTPYNGS